MGNSHEKLDKEQKEFFTFFRSGFQGQALRLKRWLEESSAMWITLSSD
jgi:hypothetical protein